jgi:hypothetical protein
VFCHTSQADPLTRSVTTPYLIAALSAQDSEIIGVRSNTHKFDSLDGGDGFVAGLGRRWCRVRLSCHLRDAIKSDPRTPDELFPDSRWRPSVAVGRGDIDWEVLIPALVSVYSGTVATECEMPDDVVGARPQGSSIATTVTVRRRFDLRSASGGALRP